MKLFSQRKGSLGMDNRNFAINVKGISFSIGRAEILKDISFTVREGEYLSVIGPNGSGKTTLLRCLDRIYRAKNGHIEIYDTPVDNYRQRDLAKLIGYVPQATGRNCPFSVYEFVLMGRYPYLTPFSAPKNDDRKAVLNALEITGVSGFAGRPLSTLSGGESQKVSIAAALAQGSKILLLDEPTTFLDPRHQEDIHKTLSYINKESGITIISATHDINSALYGSSKILALKEGSVFFLGMSEEIIKNKILDKIYDKSFVTIRHPETGMSVVL